MYKNAIQQNEEKGGERITFTAKISQSRVRVIAPCQFALKMSFSTDLLEAFYILESLSHDIPEDSFSASL